MPRKIKTTTHPGHAEAQRLADHNARKTKWNLWGPYVSERQWGTVREDYSPGGTAWEYFPHDHARSRAYRWGEDGIAGVSDDKQRLCLSLAMWNGKDPILKERLFGLTNTEGNHGEDVKELYYYLDATPTHSYLKMLYKYPQREFPYAQLAEENRRRGQNHPEFELLDTGIFDDDRYFDVFVEYAKAGPDDLLMRVTVHNRGPDEAVIHLLPQLWFRNTWSWKADSVRPDIARTNHGVLTARHAELGGYGFYFDGEPEILFCDNDTNVRRHFGWNEPGFFKDAFHEYIVHGNESAVNPQCSGTKVGILHKCTIPASGSTQICLRLVGQASRLSQTSPASEKSDEASSQRQTGSLSYFSDFNSIFTARIQEADDFYDKLQHDISSADERNVQRQAFAGMIWSKQYYGYQVREWLQGDPAQPPPPLERKHGRNYEWTHLHNDSVMSMPDKWEYPWYAAWDLAFHCIPLALVDSGFAKHQLTQLTREWYMHPERPVARLRMGIRRREPARPCVGDLARVPD